MQHLGRLLPPSYVFEGLRDVVAGRPAPAGALWWGVCLAGLYLLLACQAFAAVHRHAVRTGLIARYSAESVT
jgi:ABC-2 type transport system permease protein